MACEVIVPIIIVCPSGADRSVSSVPITPPPHVTTNVYHEFDPMYPYDQLLTHPPVIKDGKAILPERPGLGSDLLEGVEKKFPFQSDTWFVRNRDDVAQRRA